MLYTIKTEPENNWKIFCLFKRIFRPRSSLEEGNEQLISPIVKHVWNVATHSLCNLFGMSSIQLTMYTKESFDQAVVVVMWSGCLPSIETIWVWIPLKLTVFSVNFVFENSENKLKDAGFDPLNLLIMLMFPSLALKIFFEIHSYIKIKRQKFWKILKLSIWIY